MDINLYIHTVPATPDPRLDQVLALLQTLTQDINTMSETSQQHADALATQLGALDVTLKAGVAAITAEISTLKAANPAVSFTALDAAVASLGTDVAAAAAIPPAPVVSPVAP
jgi:hypothetical protein